MTKAEREALRKEVARIPENDGNAFEYGKEVVRCLDALYAAERDHLADLRRWGRHDYSCVKSQMHPADMKPKRCTCGLDKREKELAARVERAKEEE